MEEGGGEEEELLILHCSGTRSLSCLEAAGDLFTKSFWFLNETWTLL